MNKPEGNQKSIMSYDETTEGNARPFKQLHHTIQGIKQKPPASRKGNNSPSQNQMQKQVSISQKQKPQKQNQKHQKQLRPEPDAEPQNGMHLYN